MKDINSEFNKYVIGLNELVTSKSRAQLHNFYVTHKSDLIYFKQIDNTINQLLKEELLLADSVDKIISTLNLAIPQLCEMRQTIETLTANEICHEVKQKLSCHIAYIQNSMLIDGVQNANDQLKEILDLNKRGCRKEEQNRKRKEDKEHEKELKRIENDFSRRVKIMTDDLSDAITSKSLESNKLRKKMKVSLSLCILLVPIIITLPLWFKYRRKQNILLSEIKIMRYTIQYLNSK